MGCLTHLKTSRPEICQLEPKCQAWDYLILSGPDEDPCLGRLFKNEKGWAWLELRKQSMRLGTQLESKDEED